ncbi:hypothetical protein HU200_061261 [Digitaria exilis]|uniref:aspartate kinase n=1 Tax=Digitaria exilis TaxID=1010633 RepID=A0A835ACV8_9POAL|nr:hypothetical protein HU200_061261 [Digitaria exilis]
MAAAALRIPARLGLDGAAAVEQWRRQRGARAPVTVPGRRREAAAAVRCQGAAIVDKKDVARERGGGGGAEPELTVVMKFGGSPVASAERMREVADLILSFPEERPVVVLSAMGKTTNKLLMAGEKAVACGVTNVSELNELSFIKELHLGTVDQLGLDKSIICGLLDELEQLLKGIAMMKELTLRTRDYLVSFGECMSTRIFAALLNKIGVKARQGWRSGAITTLGRGGSDLTATTIGKALGLREIQVWKDVDGVLTCDPNIHPKAKPVPYLTFDEAAELAYFGAQVLHPQSMRPAREGDIPVRVKNSYNRRAPGTLITKARDMSKSVLTSIVLKSNVTMLDIVSTRMLGQYGFLAKELDDVIEELEKIAVVHLLQNRSIISLIGNVQRSSLILEKAFNVLRRNGVNVQMISQGASKVNISLIVHDSEAKQCVQALHSAFFENGFSSEIDKMDILQDGFTSHSKGTVQIH